LFVTLNFRCGRGHVAAMLVARSERGKAQRCGTCGARAKEVFTAPTAIHIPAYMRAPGSSGSTQDACDRNARYLSSEDHARKREADETRKDRVRSAEQGFEAKMRSGAAEEALGRARQKDREEERQIESAPRFRGMRKEQIRERWMCEEAVRAKERRRQ